MTQIQYRTRNRSTNRTNKILLAIPTLLLLLFLLHISLLPQLKKKIQNNSRNTFTIKNNHQLPTTQLEPAPSDICRKIPSSLKKPTDDKEDTTTINSLPFIENNVGIDCLFQNKPGIDLKYPTDAQEHFQEIHNAAMNLMGVTSISSYPMHTYYGYSGPWVENYWISLLHDFLKMNNDNNKEQEGGETFKDIFGPFVPIIIPWVDMFVLDRQVFHKVVKKVKSMMRKDVAYITVVQNAVGLEGIDLKDEFPNLLVLSAGGYGHIPIPLLLQEEDPMNDRITAKDRDVVFSFSGVLKRAPRSMRRNMHKILNRKSGYIFRHSSLSRLPQTKFYEYYYGEDWRDLMANSLFSLTPRGYGRTAYHVYEALQMGFIPIHVYLDVPWIPYADLLLNENDSDPLVYITSADEFSDFIDCLADTITVEDIERKERRILELRQTHFTGPAVMKHIKGLLTGGETDLTCQQLPNTRRDQ